MDVDGLVATSCSLHGVRATGSVTQATPMPGVLLTAVTFADAEQARIFAAACMADGIPTLQVGEFEGEPAVAVLHRNAG